MSALQFITCFCLLSNSPVTWHPSAGLRFGARSALSAQSPAHGISNYTRTRCNHRQSIQRLLVELVQFHRRITTEPTAVTPCHTPGDCTHSWFSHRTRCTRKLQWTAAVRLTVLVMRCVKMYFMGVVRDTGRDALLIFHPSALHLTVGPYNFLLTMSWPGCLSLWADSPHPAHEARGCSPLDEQPPYGGEFSARSSPLCLHVYTWPKNTWLTDTFKYGGNQMSTFPNTFGIWEHAQGWILLSSWGSSNNPNGFNSANTNGILKFHTLSWKKK